MKKTKNTKKCREFVIQAQKASTSLLQRKFRIGYNKAARIIDRLEEEGVMDHSLVVNLVKFIFDNIMKKIYKNIEYINKNKIF